MTFWGYTFKLCFKLENGGRYIVSFCGSVGGAVSSYAGGRGSNPDKPSSDNTTTKRYATG